MEPRYKLVFTAKLTASCSAEQAMAEVTAVFKLPTAAVSKLICAGKPRAVRRDVDRLSALCPLQGRAIALKKLTHPHASGALEQANSKCALPCRAGAMALLKRRYRCPESPTNVR